MTATTTQVDGFTYSTTAPARRISRTTQHYVEQAEHARAGVSFAALELTLDAAARAAVAR